MLHKRLLTFLLVAALLLTVVPLNVIGETQHYDDIGNHWAKNAILRWNEFGILEGSGGKSMPDAFITRAEMAAVIDRIMQYAETDDSGWADLSDSA